MGAVATETFPAHTQMWRHIQFMWRHTQLVSFNAIRVRAASCDVIIATSEHQTAAVLRCIKKIKH